MLYTSLLAAIAADKRPICEAQTLELLDKYKLNYRVETVPLYTSEGSNTPFFATQRMDTKETFAAVGKNYTCLQNEDFVSACILVSDMLERPISDFQVLKNGAQLVCNFDMLYHDVSVKNVDDVLGERIMMCTSHDKSKSFGMGIGYLVLSCTNGMTRFDRQAFKSIKHTFSAKEMVRKFKSGISEIEALNFKTIDVFRAMRYKNIGEKEVNETVRILTGFDGDKTAFDKVGKRMQKIVESATESIATEMSYKGQTAWGLWNGATHYTSRLAESEESALREKLFGKTAKKDLQILQILA